MFFANRDCKYYPCHQGIKGINCLFCYCPLYLYEDCGGDFRKTKKGKKDCTPCIRPHIPDNYDEIIKAVKAQDPGQGGVQI